MTGLRFVGALALAGLATGCTEVSMAGGVGGGGGGRLDVAAYDDAVASLGCQLTTEADYGAVEFQTGMSRDQVVSITQRRLSREQAVRLDNGGVRLTTGTCAV